MDESQLEYAAALEQWARDFAIEEAHRKEQRTKPEVFDGSCPTCGAEIHPLRVAAGYYNCVDCARESELRARLTPYRERANEFP